MILVSHVSRLVKNFKIGIFQTVNAINAELCMVVLLLLELYLFTSLSMTLIIFHGRSSVIDF